MSSNNNSSNVHIVTPGPYSFTGFLMEMSTLFEVGRSNFKMFVARNAPISDHTKEKIGIVYQKKIIASYKDTNVIKSTTGNYYQVISHDGETGVFPCTKPEAKHLKDVFRFGPRSYIAGRSQLSA